MNQEQLDRKYYYQRFDWLSRRPVKNTGKPDSLIFLEKINLDGAWKEEFLKDYRLLLFDFETHILSNIHWYEKKIIKEKTLRTAYILISLSLLLLVPILVALIQRYSDSVGAEITAIFTGFFALYQGVAKMLESRNVIATYWQTNSNLKSRLYSLEDKWKYMVLTRLAADPKASPWTEELLIELRDDLRKAVRFGIDSVKTEKQLFFDGYSYPKFNILGSILGTRAQVSELFKRDDSDPTTTYKRRDDIPTNPNLRLAQLTEVADEPLTERTSDGPDKEEKKASKTGGSTNNSGSSSGSGTQNTSSSIGSINSLFGSAAESLDIPFVSREAWGARPNTKGATPLGKLMSFVIHHADGYWDDGQNGAKLMRDIQKLHQDPPRGWADIGYHFVIDSVGKVYQGREFLDIGKDLFDKPIFSRGAHAGGFNKGRIGICLLGSFHPPSNHYKGSPPSDATKQSLVRLLSYLNKTYRPIGDPHINGEIIGGHRDYKATSCPGDDAYKIVEDLRKMVRKVERVS